MSTLHQESTATSALAGPGARPGWRRISAGIALALLSAVMVFIAFPDLGGLYPLLLIAFVPMYVAQYRLLPRRLSAIPMLITASTYWFTVWYVAWDLLPGKGWMLFFVGLFFGAWCAILDLRQEVL